METETENDITSLDDLASSLVEQNELDGCHEQAFVAYLEWLGYDHTSVDTDWSDVISEFMDSYCGEYSSHEDFIHEYMDEVLSDLPDWLVGHIDYDSVWDCELRYDFFEENGHYFRNI